MTSYNYKKLQDLDELFDAYVNHWEGISQSSISAMKRLIDANKAITRVRELHENHYGKCIECSVFVDDGINYPCSTIKALDGEQ